MTPRSSKPFQPLPTCPGEAEFPRGTAPHKIVFAWLMEAQSGFKAVPERSGRAASNLGQDTGDIPRFLRQALQPAAKPKNLRRRLTPRRIKRQARPHGGGTRTLS